MRLTSGCRFEKSVEGGTSTLGWVAVRQKVAWVAKKANHIVESFWLREESFRGDLD